MREITKEGICSEIITCFKKKNNGQPQAQWMHFFLNIPSHSSYIFFWNTYNMCAILAHNNQLRKLIVTYAG